MTNTHGWKGDGYWSDPAVEETFRRKPLEGIDKVRAKYAHLREQKRLTEAEERARAELDG